MASRYGLEIRAAGPADAPELAALMEACGVGTDPRGLAQRLSSLRDGPGTVLLAAQWGPPSGVAALHWIPALEEDRPMALLSLLLVAPDDRRQGIGRLLLKAASQAARAAGCGRLALLAGPESPSLQGFCRANGFAEAGTGFVRPLRRQG